ncbi:MaoC/PaaZ C-terminal domain-containing protein [Anaerolineales bacterium HSG24]|nr:MaoC/PaaZ C-terminal domain-containing protein [Anaerolineales bacterium HSG24]
MTLIVRGMYFEQFEVGQELNTSARTITETDIVNFAGLSGDFNFIHTNAPAAKETLYGQRIAHGMLVASIATGLAVQQGFIDGTTLAFRELNWKFSQAVFIGDTIHVETNVVATKQARRMGGGFVTFAAKVINQKGEVVQKGEWKMLIQSQDEKNEA